MDTDLSLLIEAACEGVSSIAVLMPPDGVWCPGVFVLDSEGIKAGMLIDMPTDSVRRAEYLRRAIAMIAAGPVSAAVFVCDAYAEQEDDPGNRREIVAVAAVAAGGGEVLVAAEVTREEGRAPRLGEWSTGAMEGPAANALRAAMR